MGMVKIADLHKLLDLVDEVTEKTELLISLQFSTYGNKEKYMTVNLCAYKVHPAGSDFDEHLETTFYEIFYVGDTPLAKVEPYVNCRVYLKSLIQEADKNV